VTGTPGANIAAREADLAIAIGTRLSDFTTGIENGLQNPAVRFLAINVAEFDAFKHAALPLVATRGPGWNGSRTPSRATASMPVMRSPSPRGRPVGRGDRPHFRSAPWPAHQPGRGDWRGEPRRASARYGSHAAGSCRETCTSSGARDAGRYHMEYGNSCMGYEIAGGLGAKMADPSRDVYVMVGDASYLMMSSKLSPPSRKAISSAS